jgi:hypothetical protein
MPPCSVAASRIFLATLKLYELLSRLWRLPAHYVAIALAGVVSVALSILVVSGAFEPQPTITGSIFFDACNNGPADDGCVRRSHYASGVAVEYRAVGLLPVSYTTHTGSDGVYRLSLPPGKYRVNITGCKSWIGETSSPPLTVVPRVPIDPDRLDYNWVIHENGTCELGAVAL